MENRKFEKLKEEVYKERRKTAFDNYNNLLKNYEQVEMALLKTLDKPLFIRPIYYIHLTSEGLYRKVILIMGVIEPLIIYLYSDSWNQFLFSLIISETMSVISLVCILGLELPKIRFDKYGIYDHIVVIRGEQSSLRERLKELDGITDMSVLEELINAQEFALGTVLTKQPFLKKISIDRTRLPHTLLVGSPGTGIAIRSFSLSDFDESKACGYAKLIDTGKGLRIQIIAAPIEATQAEKDKYLSEGYIKVGKIHY